MRRSSNFTQKLKTEEQSKKTSANDNVIPRIERNQRSKSHRYRYNLILMPPFFRKEESFPFSSNVLMRGGDEELSDCFFKGELINCLLEIDQRAL